MSIQTLMATAASYMEDFGLDQEAQIVYQWESAPKNSVIKALNVAAQYAQQMMRQHADDANDLYMAVTEAKKAFMPTNVNESKRNNKKRIFENQMSNEYAVCVTERDDWGNRGDRVITTGSKEYCENWVEDYCQRYSWNRGLHNIKPVAEVDDPQFKRDYFGNNSCEDDFADLEDMLDNVGVSVNRSDVFGESKNRKNIVKLTESELKRVINESIKKVLKENDIKGTVYSNDFNPSNPYNILLDIVGQQASKEYSNDYEIVGKSGVLYRILTSPNEITVMWANAETHDWDDGEEYRFSRNKPFVNCIIEYIISSARM